MREVFRVGGFGVQVGVQGSLTGDRTGVLGTILASSCAVDAFVHEPSAAIDGRPGLGNQRMLLVRSAKAAAGLAVAARFRKHLVLVLRALESVLFSKSALLRKELFSIVVPFARAVFRLAPVLLAAASAACFPYFHQVLASRL